MAEMSVEEARAVVRYLEWKLQRKKWAAVKPPKPPTKAQLAKVERDRRRGEMYLAKANALGVYNSCDDCYD